ncbi:MAG: hypothetical protein GY950_22835, partial [bacterium]|nr:hypothetical protein [bacterium]
DLLFRVKADTPIILPPLRERKEDIPLLARFFVKKYEKVYNANERTLADEALEKLMSYPWPGNIRVLESVLENAIYNYRGLKVLSANHLVIKKDAIRTVPEQKVTEPQKETGIKVESLPPHDLTTLLESVSRFDFDALKQEELKGRLPQIQDVYSRFLARYLNTTLKSTLKYSSQNPEGEISYHRAIKLMTGDFGMKAMSAKRLLKSLLKVSPGALIDLWKSEPLIKEAIERYGDDRLKAEFERLSSQEKE